MFEEYTAHAIINVFGYDIKISLPFLEEKYDNFVLREMILEDINENLYIKSYDYTETTE